MKLILYMRIILEIIHIRYSFKYTQFNIVLCKYLTANNKSTIPYDDKPKESFAYLQSLFEAVKKVSSVCFVKAKCLERTLVLYKFLKEKYDIPIRMVIGVSKFPFASHTWLMWNEEIDPNALLTDFEENLVNYQIIFDSEKDLQKLTDSIKEEK